MRYDPFHRGPYPVGVRSVELRDPARDRALPVEVWYPAQDRHAGQDLAADTQDQYRPAPMAPPVSQEAVRDAEMHAGRFPVIVFSHGWGGHRRQSTHLCTHLASHGYVVASVDHTGNTILDMMQLFMEVRSGQRPDVEEALAMVGGFAENRPADVSFVLDRLLAGEAGPAAEALDPDRIGASGHSFGGWTTLHVAGRDRRIRAALPLAPAGGRTPLVAGRNPLELLDLAWGRDVPTLFLVAEHDTLLPLEGMHDLLGRTRSPRRMIVLRDADHMHFCDRVEETHELFRLMAGMMSPDVEGMPDFSSVLSGMRPISQLCPGPQAYAFTRGLGLAHMDAHLKQMEEAASLLASDLEQLLAERGVAVEVVD
jgi:dienelactone hydrolase